MASKGGVISVEVGWVERLRIPISEFSNTFIQLASSIKLRVLDCHDVDFWEGMMDQCSKVFWEPTESIVATLDSVSRNFVLR
jgi:hypothetical protein